MFNTQKDQLFTLISSLTKAEKRSFKLYAKRFSKSDSKFIQLFDVLDKLAEYDEEAILKKMTALKKKNLSNVKRHLYKQILISLRLIYIQKNIDIEIREQLDFARILYGKGLYMQSLKLLERIKRIALENHQDVLHLEILEFQKMIEARHITRSRTVQNKMDNLIKESTRRSLITYAASRLSNFNIQVQGWYIDHGHVKSEQDKEAVLRFFRREKPKEQDQRQLTFFENVNIHQSHFWLHYILLDIKGAEKFVRQWINLFHISPQMREQDPDLYMRGLYYLCVFLYMDANEKEFCVYFDRFKAFIEEYKGQMNDNSRMIAFVYVNLLRLNFCVLTGAYAEGLALVPKIKAEIPLYDGHTDPHRLLLFYYKFAAIHFCCGDYNGALDHLNEIVHQNTSHLREDLHAFSRILQIFCHYELGNYSFLDYLIPSVQRQFDKSKELGRLPGLILQFVKELARAPEYESKELLAQMEEKINALATSPYELKSLIYLDPRPWLQSRRRKIFISELRPDNQKKPPSLTKTAVELK